MSLSGCSRTMTSSPRSIPRIFGHAPSRLRWLLFGCRSIAASLRRIGGTFVYYERVRCWRRSGGSYWAGNRARLKSRSAGQPPSFISPVAEMATRSAPAAMPTPSWPAPRPFSGQSYFRRFPSRHRYVFALDSRIARPPVQEIQCWSLKQGVRPTSGPLHYRRDSALDRQGGDLLS